MLESKILENVGILERTSIHHSYQVDLMTMEDVKVHQGITKAGPSDIFFDPCRGLALNFSLIVVSCGLVRPILHQLCLA